MFTVVDLVSLEVNCKLQERLMGNIRDFYVSVFYHLNMNLMSVDLNLLIADITSFRVGFNT